MKGKEVKDEGIYRRSEILSSSVRNLCFAGIAIIWVFRVESEVPRELLWPAMMFVCAIFFDLMQYSYQVLSWSIFYKLMASKYPGKVDNTEIGQEAPDWINWPSYSLLGLKVALSIVGYGFIGTFMLRNIFVR